MITIYSDDSQLLQNKNVGVDVEQPQEVDSPQVSYEDILSEIQDNLKAFESIDWSQYNRNVEPIESSTI